MGVGVGVGLEQLRVQQVLALEDDVVEHVDLGRVRVRVRVRVKGER